MAHKVNFLDMAVAVGYIDYIDLDNCPLHHCTCSVVEVGLLDCPIDLALDYCRDLDFHTYFEEEEVLEVHKLHIVQFQQFHSEHPIAVFL